MARRYVRDNRGRFAPKGSGATARGGRLKTASGKKRETQTMKTSGGGVPGTIGKNKSTKLKPQQIRDLQSKSRQLKASASRNSARMGNTGISPAQGAKFAKAAAADRKAAAAIDKKLKGQATPPTVFARSSRIKGEEIGGKYKGKGKTSLYGKDLAKTSAARPGSTVRKPKGLKPGTIKPKPQVSKAAKQRLDAKRAARRAPGTRRAVGKISEAKAGRIVERIDAQRFRKALPGRRTANFLRTMERRSEFILKPAAAARKKGKDISVNESVQKAVLNAAKRAKRRRR